MTCVPYQFLATMGRSKPSPTQSGQKPRASISQPGSRFWIRKANMSSLNNQEPIMELEVPWNPAQVCSDLQKACQILSERCLKLSAKWAVEQWMGLPPEVVRESGSMPSAIPEDLVFRENSPAVYYAKTLMDLGEFAHAAATLSQPPLGKAAVASVESMPPPLPDLSPFGFYLRAYALYLAGERRKEEEFTELKRSVVVIVVVVAAALPCDSSRHYRSVSSLV